MGLLTEIFSKPVVNGRILGDSPIESRKSVRTKFNPNHGPDGRFASSGSSAARGQSTGSDATDMSESEAEDLNQNLVLHFDKFYGKDASKLKAEVCRDVGARLGTHMKKHGVAESDLKDFINDFPLRRVSGPASWGIFGGSQTRVTDIKPPKNLSGDKLKRYAVSAVLNQWAGTSGDSNPKSIAIQSACAELFDSGSTYQTKGPGSAEAIRKSKQVLEKHRNTIKAIIGAMYENTQERLKKDGVTEAVVYRGIYVFKNVKDEVMIKSNPISSFAYDIVQAANFSGAEVPHDPNALVIARKIKAEDILATPGTGMGCVLEQEVVVIGRGKMRAKVSQAYDSLEDYYTEDFGDG